MDTTPARAEVKARVRAKLDARKQQPARDYLLDVLHATHTHAGAAAVLDRFERESETAARLSAVLDACDEVQRAGEQQVDVRRIQRAALGDT